MWHCLAPFFASHSARTFSIEVGGKATLKGNSELYRDMVVMFCGESECKSAWRRAKDRGRS
jgi:hypothetical protein